jgi:hypothetical protein
VRKREAVVDAIYNPFEPGFHEDPYDQYARIRATGRTQRSLFDNLLVHRYDDCFAILRRTGTSVEEANAKAEVRRFIPSSTSTRPTTPASGAWCRAPSPSGASTGCGRGCGC